MDQETSDPDAEFYVVACGQGDSLLLRLGTDWLAVDCFLPKGKEKVWDRYTGLVRELGIERLRGLVITHFDIDHYRGAARLIDWFARERSGIGGIYATASLRERVLARAVLARYKRPPERTEFAQLRKAIFDRCLPNGDIPLHIITADQPPLELGTLGNGWYLVAIYPFEGTVLQCVEAASVEDVNALRRIDHNELSAVIMVCHRNVPFPLLLLGGDVPGDKAWEVAMKYWRDTSKSMPHRDWLPSDSGPLWIKVPHHGSMVRGHSEHIFDPPAPSDLQPHAFISAATDRPPLPDRRTVRTYFDHGFQVWDTGKIFAPSLRNHSTTWGASVLSSSGSEKPTESQKVAIRALFSQNKPEPLQAKVEEEDVEQYGVAATGSAS